VSPIRRRRRAAIAAALLMKWILLLMVLGHNGQALDHIRFTSEEACERARSKFGGVNLWAAPRRGDREGRMSPPGRSASSLPASLARKPHVEYRAMRRGGLGPQLAAVAADDQPADRQTHPHALALGGEERLEDALHMLGPDAFAGIGKCDEHVVRVDRLRFH